MDLASLVYQLNSEVVYPVPVTNCSLRLESCKRVQLIQTLKVKKQHKKHHGQLLTLTWLTQFNNISIFREQNDPATVHALLEVEEPQAIS